MRPPNWKNPFSSAALSVRDREWKPVSHHDAYEAGADAMLKARNKEVRDKILCLDSELDNTIDGNSLFRSMVILEFIVIQGEEAK